MNIKHLKFKTLLILALFAFNFYTVHAQSRDSVPDFKVVDLNGNVHKLHEYLSDGKYVVIDFFSVGCITCQLYAPQVNQSYHDFGCNSEDVIVLGINYGDHNSSVAQFDSTFGIEFPTASGLDGGGNAAAEAFNIIYFPYILIISPDYQIYAERIVMPVTQNINDSLMAAGLTFQDCPPVSVAKYEDISKFEINPNPSNGYIHLHLGNNENFNNLSFFVSDIQGRIVYSETMAYAREQKDIMFDLRNIPNGMYFLNIFNENILVSTEKLIISH